MTSLQLSVPVIECKDAGHEAIGKTCLNRCGRRIARGEKAIEVSYQGRYGFAHKSCQTTSVYANPDYG